jgi:hypothetical protein
LIKVVHALNIPVSKLGLISEFAGWSLVSALTEHDPKMSACQETPALSCILAVTWNRSAWFR